MGIAVILIFCGISMLFMLTLSVLLMKAGRVEEDALTIWHEIQLRRRIEEITGILDNAEAFGDTRPKLEQINQSLKKSLEKERKKCEKKREEGNYSSVFDYADLAGYALMNIIRLDSKNALYKTMFEDILCLHGKAYAKEETNFLFASTIGRSIAFLGIWSLLIAWISGMKDNSQMILLVILVGLLGIVMIRKPFSVLSDEAQHRRKMIDRELPQVCSKLAILISSGIEMKRAWELTAVGSEGVLYQEMRTVVYELDRNQGDEAFIHFINRCNSKEIARLGSAILQNMSKGNDELADQLQVFASDMWEERRQRARTAGEEASTKLMLPMTLTFIGIMLLIFYPALSMLSI